MYFVKKSADGTVSIFTSKPALAAIGWICWARIAEFGTSEVLSSDFIRTARAKGRTRGSAIMRHGVRVALIPMSTFFAYSFGTILTGAAVTEKIFSWHGMGEYLIDSVSNNDINAATGSILFAAILVLIAGTLADVLYAALDPRVRM
ncbi:MULTISPECIES: ABC transporter permease [unclassified Microbacterium]|uniref:ABC transporter permease n=1 Tax=unclassified Microbacterium TaxID=2609290 RepID=UPI0030175DF0